MLNNFLLQAQQITKLSEEGIKAVSEIQDPMTRFVIIATLIFIALLIYTVYFLFKLKVKDIDGKGDEIKKKRRKIRKTDVPFHGSKHREH